MPIVNSASREYRRTSTKKMVDEIHQRTGIPKRDIQDVIHFINRFITDSLASGHAVNFYGCGTLFHRFRKGRANGMKNHQPDTLMIKFSAAHPLRQRLAETCAEMQKTPEFQQALEKQQKRANGKLYVHNAPFKRSEGDVSPFESNSNLKKAAQ